jgi:uncharacterized membrane protein YGL010W
MNRLCHLVGIPLIVFSLLGLLSFYSNALALDLALALWAGASLWYAKLDKGLALALALTSLGLLILAQAVSVYYLWTLFILGWILQFVGHRFFEKNSPAFFIHLKHLLIGPLWVFNEVFAYHVEE